jgi:uncharacterized protein (DUF1778 family)
VSNADAAADALEARLSDDDRALLDDCADWLTRKRLATAAIMWLAALEPANFVIASQSLLLRPYLRLLRDKDMRLFDRLRTLLEERGAIELLLRRLEARA